MLVSRRERNAAQGDDSCRWQHLKVELVSELWNKFTVGNIADIAHFSEKMTAAAKLAVGAS